MMPGTLSKLRLGYQPPLCPGLHIVSADQVIVRDVITGVVQQVSVQKLQPAPASAPAPQRQTDLSLISERDWAMAQIRYEAIKPLLEACRLNALAFLFHT
jgi:hypothetical protein